MRAGRGHLPAWILAALTAAFLVLSGALLAADGDPIDYADWERVATIAENEIASGEISSVALDDLRARIVLWRSKFLAAKDTNAPQIATLKSQIDSLGPVPAEGESEEPEIAKRRSDLNAMMSKLQAPVLAAEEAYSRAEGIVRQIDTLVRQRQASELMRLLPSPLNPLHWPSGAAVLTQGSKTLWKEFQTSWADPVKRDDMGNNALGIVISAVCGLLLLARGSHLTERLTRRLQRRGSMRANTIVAAIVSVGQVLVPFLGMLLLMAAILLTGMVGPRLEALFKAVPRAGLAYFATSWIASWLFQGEERGFGLRLTDRPTEARFLSRMLGLLMAAEIIRVAFVTEVRPPLSHAAQAVWLTPLIFVASLVLFRLGVLLRRRKSGEVSLDGDDARFRDSMVRIFGTVIVGVAILAPLLAAVGYAAAANALIWPLLRTLGLVGLIILIQRFIADIYVAVTGSGEDGREGLIPVLVGFMLVTAALPAFALIWGARAADLVEVWARFQTGVSIGKTHISPTAVTTLLIVFAIGYMITRFVQGAVGTAVLPRTRLDKGAQTAFVSGIGYVGILLSGIAAVTTAGIDLSGLAIVAGALSVGIGFGMRNIAENFIAGIILLVERPITQGDTIEVGSKIGTVKAISVRSTRIITADQTEVVVPNAEFVSTIVTNWTRDSLRTRILMPVTVAFTADTRKAADILKEIVEAQPLVLLDPEPSVLFAGIGQDGLILEIRAIISDLNFKLVVQSDINHAIVARFREEGIEMPQGAQHIVTQVVTMPAARAARKAAAGGGPAGATAAAPRPRKVRAPEIFNDPDSDPEVTGKRDA